MFADECNHRDVNHTFATMDTDDPNPFVEKHKANAVHAWRLDDGGLSTDIGNPKTLGTKDPFSPDLKRKLAPDTVGAKLKAVLP
mmetsp:Transcript_76480/g.123673  ORF Transcript_76480/g.123673 Transcript_76480/m.123673 type:complete len:84 (+) Transcript_76480:3-254(+)